MPSKNTIPEDVWATQAVLYELGLKHGNEIAEELGVSPQTVSRQMKRRGVVKGSRVHETVARLDAELDRKARCAAIMEMSDSRRRRKVSQTNAQAIGFMVKALLDANRQGDLAVAAPAIDRIYMAVAGKRRRHSPR